MASLSLQDRQVIANKFFGRQVRIKTAFESERQKFGSVGEYKTLRIVLDDDSEAVLFVKRILSKPKRPQFVNLLMKKEEQFYRFLENRNLSGFAPKCYFTDERCLVLEDLSELGFEMRNSLGVGEVKVALATLAKLHAASLTHPADFDESVMLKEAMYSEDSAYIGHTYIKYATEAVSNLIEVQLLESVKAENCIHKFRETVSNTLKLLNQKTRFKNVCCHGDLWCNNLLFKYESGVSTDCRLVDFQLIRYAPPAHDVTTLIFHSVNEQTIRNNLFDFYKTYYECLRDEMSFKKINLESVLPFTEFMETCKLYNLVAKTTKILMMVIEAAILYRVSSNSVATPLDEVMKNNAFLLAVIANNKEFAEKFGRSINEFQENLLNPKLNKEDCYLVLNSKHYDVLEKKLQRCTTRLSYTSNYQTLTLKVFQNNLVRSSKYLVKFANENLQGFNNECKLFSNNPLTNFSPRCYLVIKNNLIVYENFFDRDYTNVPSQKCFGLDEVRIVLKTMAKMHASTLDFPETLCHGNLNHQNIILKYNEQVPIDALFINFEESTMAHPALDFLSFLYFTTQLNFRAYQTENMQKFYYEQLEANVRGLDKFLTYEQFLDGCKRFKQQALDAAVEYHSRALIEEKYEELKDQTWKSDFEAVKQKMYEDHPVYRDRQDQMQQEMFKLQRRF